MAPTLYAVYLSPPVRAVLITAKAIGLDLNIIEMDYHKGDFHKPEYLKLNPQHTVPTFVDDDGFILCDSHAIMAYIVSKYAKNDNLYPKDIKKRAIIDQRLHFETGITFTRLRAITFPTFIGVKTSLQESEREPIYEAYQFLEAFLEDKEWMAGDSVTIADYSLITSVGSLDILAPIDSQKYPKLVAWMKRVEQLPEYEANKKGHELFANFLKSKLSL